jgi:catechol 2,3-dioxygenase-like lactoylglutathione lyase family enzyme
MSMRHGLWAAGAAVLLAVFAIGETRAAQPPARPRIYGIAYVTFRVSQTAPADAFYSTWLDLERGSAGGCQAYRVGTRQQILIEAGLRAGEDERLVSLGFVTESPDEVRAFLTARGLPVEDATRCGQRVVRVADPEGHVIEFVGPNPHDVRSMKSGSGHVRILHVGLTVRDVGVMDGFYKDALGFSEIWRGGQNDQTVDWINMKTPDGTEYIEYMLVGATPVTRSRLGSMHHVAIVVDDMQEAYEAVLARVPRDRVKEIGSPRVGRNRRWQLNLFDPDGTRTELMERAPMR